MSDFRDRICVYCADVGSIAGGNFAWASGGATGDAPDSEFEDIEALSAAVARDLSEGRPVALGFESPLVVPVPVTSGDLGKARNNEGDRAWSSGGGVTVLGTGVVQMAWVLRAIREALGDELIPQSFIEWKFFENAKAGLLVWEAFVSKGAHAQPDGVTDRNLHREDARTGVRTFEEFASGSGLNEGDVSANEPLSLAGAAIIWSQLSDDPELVRQHGLVLKAN